MGSTDWIREDYPRPLPTQRELLPWPDFPDVHLGIRLTAEEYAALLKRLADRQLEELFLEGVELIAN